MEQIVIVAILTWKENKKAMNVYAKQNFGIIINRMNNA